MFFLNFFAYTSMSHYSEDSKKKLTVELVILCKNWLILSDANNSFVPHLYSQRNCTETWISLCFGFWSNWDFPTLWPVGKYWLDLIGDEPQKNIGQDICKQYWQGLIGDEPPKILAKIFAKKTGRVSSVMSFKLTGNDCGWDDQAMAVHIQCNCWRLFHLWKWFGLEGGEWSSAKGLVAPCCKLFSASILFLELPIEVFRSFGTTRIIYWPLFFLQQKPLVCSHVAKIN